MAYQPKEFDRIRLEMEGKTLHHNDYLWLERLAVWLFIGFTASVVVITLLFAVKADALETVNIDGNFALSSIYSDGLYNSDKNYHVQLAPNLWAKLSAGVSVPG